MTMTETLTDALARAARARRLLIALDFDGTLAPFTVDPADSRPLPEAREALATLAGLPRTAVAVISGRPLEFLRAVVDPEARMALSGSHGAETDLSAVAGACAGGELELSAEQTELLEEAVSTTRELVRKYPGSRAEQKPAGVAFHTRPIEDPEVAQRALAEMTRVYAHLPGLRLTPGQQVIECSVVSDTKGDGLRAIQSVAAPELTVFAGDDATDEDAMRLLGDGDVGIKVGDRQTVAGHRVSGPEELAGILSVFARERAAVTGAE